MQAPKTVYIVMASLFLFISACSEGGISGNSSSSSSSLPEILKIYTETSYPNSTPSICAPTWGHSSDAGNFNSTEVTTDTGEGTQSKRCNLKSGSGAWSICTASGKTSRFEDFSRFANGFLKCKMMVPVGFSQNVRIGIQCGISYPPHTHSVQNHVVNPFDYGLISDGNWHDISIPFSALNIPTTGTYSLKNIQQTWIITSDTSPTADAFIYFDDVRWEAAP